MSTEDEVASLKRRVDLLERRLNNWVSARAEDPTARVAGKYESSTSRPKLFASKYDGNCATCGGPYFRTEAIWWQKRDGKTVVWHQSCEAPK